MPSSQQQSQMERPMDADTEGCEMSYRSDMHLQMALSAYLTDFNQDESLIQLPEGGYDQYTKQVYQNLEGPRRPSDGQGQNLERARDQDWLQQYDCETNGFGSTHTFNLDDSGRRLMNEALASSSFTTTKSVSSKYLELSGVSKTRPARTRQTSHDRNWRFGLQAEGCFAEQSRATSLECNKKISPHGPCAKLYRIEQIDGKVFDLEGRSMDYAVIRTLTNVMMITGIGRSTLQRAQ